MSQKTLEIHCCRPSLPRAGEILPYLERIDETGWYTNYGPLNGEFERRLGEHFRAAAGCITTVSSGTAGLTVALMASDARRDGYCILPSFTFVATAHAACFAGLKPFFVDVDDGSWALTPAIARQALREAPGPVSAVIPVSAFGAPVDAAEWAEFRSETGVPVVIDAADGFDTARSSSVPTVVSLHATKLFGVGEGGLVLCDDAGAIERIQRHSNFGFFERREADVTGTNAKLSEYHAAVGLAGLDAWPKRRQILQQIAGQYRQRLDAAGTFRTQEGFGSSWLASTLTVDVGVGKRDIVAAGMLSRGIETRAWWGAGCASHRAFRDCPRTSLQTTERLAARIVSFPFHAGLGSADVDRIVESARSSSP